MNSDYEMASQNGPQSKSAARKEGPVARAIEDQTAKLPSDLFLWLAGASIVGSAALRLVEALTPLGKDTKGTLSNFVGMWAPTILLLGLYNKLVKVAGSNQVSK